jgi:NAD(P)H-flavin reductase
MEEDQIFISMERNMKCGTGFCGHCQLGPLFVCKDGPVFNFREIKPFFKKREL